MHVLSGGIKSLNMIQAIKATKYKRLALKISQTFGDGISSPLIVRFFHIKNSIVHPNFYFCVIFHHINFQIIRLLALWSVCWVGCLNILGITSYLLLEYPYSATNY